MSRAGFYDPFREVLSEDKGPGCDRLTLSCGHQIVVDHRSGPRKKARCHQHGCRQPIRPYLGGGK
jgi:hypothetical protein